MKDVLSIPTMYLYVAVAVLAAAYVGLWAYNRREIRREWAQKAAAICREWGLVRIADLLDCYARGDYSEIVRTMRKFVTEMRTGPGAIVEMLWDATVKVATYVASKDAAKAAELVKILGAGMASKAEAPTK